MDENESIENEDVEEFSVQRWQKENEVERKEIEAAEIAEEEKFAAAVDDDGNWRSEKHRQNYYGEKPDSEIIGAPDPEDYKDQYLFEEDLEAYKATGLLAGGLEPTPDDKYSIQKQELTNQIMEHRRKEALAIANGKREHEELHKYHALSLERELEALPESPKVTQARKNITEFRESNLEGYFTGELAEPIGNAGRLAHDSAIEAARHIEAGNLETFYLPRQISPHSYNHEEFKPVNLVKFKGLPDHVKQAIELRLSSTTDKSPESIFHAVWSQLQTSGYAELGKASPTVKPPKKRKAKKKTTRDMKNMSQKEFIEFRRSQGAREF